MEQTTINCPHCKSSFDITGYLYNLRDRLFKKIDVIIRNMREERLE